METYRIMRFYQAGFSEEVAGMIGLSLEEAQEHCCDPETSSSTCVLPANTERTEVEGNWFDGYEPE